MAFEKTFGRGPTLWVGDEIYMIFGSCQVILKEIIKNNSSFKTSPPEDDNLLSISISSAGDGTLPEPRIPSMAIVQGDYIEVCFIIESKAIQRKTACVLFQGFRLLHALKRRLHLKHLSARDY